MSADELTGETTSFVVNPATTSRRGEAGVRTIAAVDCGTNSIRLLISAVDTTGRVVEEVTRLNTIVRLGEGVDATGEFSAAALERVRAALARYVDIMAAAGVTAVRMVATSAARDVSNREDFFALTRELLGRIQPGAQAEVIAGTEEARLSFMGAIADLPGGADGSAALETLIDGSAGAAPGKSPQQDAPVISPQLDASAAPVASPQQDAPVDTITVIDLGGGSTEFVTGQRNRATGEVTLLGAISTQMGCVRLTERCLHSDPPTSAELADAREVVRQQLDTVRVSVPVADSNIVVGCAGTMTTLSALIQDLEEYDPTRIHMSRLAAGDVRAMCRTLRGETVAQRNARPQVLDGRADVIAGGCVVVEEIVDFFHTEAGITELVISEKDILDGVIAELATRG